MQHPRRASKRLMKYELLESVDSQKMTRSRFEPYRNCRRPNSLNQAMPGWTPGAKISSDDGRVVATSPRDEH